MSSFPFSQAMLGQVLDFSYPTDNRVKASTRLKRRRLVVRRIRDLEAQPLQDVTLLQNPDLRRSRYLILGEDLDKHAFRSFYLGSARRISMINVPLFRIGVYDPLDERKPVHFVGPLFTDSKHDRECVELLLAYFRYSSELKSGIVHAAGLFAVNQERTDHVHRRPRPVQA